MKRIFFFLWVAVGGWIPPSLEAAPFPYVLYWKRLFGEAQPKILVQRDSLVFVAGGDGQVLAARCQDGTPIWRHSGNGPVESLVVVGEDLVLADAWGRLQALDWRTGEERWKAWCLGKGEAELVVGDTLLYVSSADGWLYALRVQDGSQVWRVRLGPRSGIQPCWEGGRVYAAAQDGRLIAVAADAGIPLAEVEVGSPLVAGPQLAGRGLAVADEKGYVRTYARRNLRAGWAQRLGARAMEPLLVGDGLLVCAADNGWLYGLSLEKGRVEWKQELGSRPLAGPTLGPQGEVVIGTEKGRLLGVQMADGGVLWDEPVGEGGGVWPQGGEGWLYASGGDGYLYAFGWPLPVGRAPGTQWEDWEEIFSFGHKIGYLHRWAQIVQRGGEEALLLTAESAAWNHGFCRETSQVWVDAGYRPLALAYRRREGDQVIETEGAWFGDTLRVEQRLAGYVVREEAVVGRDLLLPEVALLGLARQGRLVSGRRDSVLVFDYATLGKKWLHLVCGSVEPAPAGPALALRLRRAVPPLGELEVLTWVDEQGRSVREQVPWLGTEQVRAREDQACRWSPPGPARRVWLDHPVGDPAQLEELVLDLPATLGDPKSLVVEEERQQLRFGPEGKAQLTLRPGREEGGDLRLPIRDPALTSYLESSLYIQAEDPRLQALAQRLRGEEDDAWKVANRLRQWVYDQMIPRRTDVTFKSALEVLEDMEGTCSEYAVLYLALCRAAGVPARACVGFLASGQELVLHLWTQVYVGRWIDVDPSWRTGRVSAAYLKTGQGRLAADLEILNLPLALWLARADTVAVREWRAGARHFLAAAEVLFAEAQQAERQFQDEQAQALYRQLAQLPWNQRSGEARIAMARYGLQRGALDPAVQACEEVLRQVPPDPAADEALFYLARVAEVRGQWKAAADYLERLVAEYPDGELADDALGRLGEIYEQQEGCQAARLYYERVREEYSQSGWAAVAESALARCREKEEGKPRAPGGRGSAD